MKKLLFLLSILMLTGLGCQQKVVLKAPKEKIVSYRILHWDSPEVGVPLFGGLGSNFTTSTATTVTTSAPIDLVEYAYVSPDIATATPYFSDNLTVSNAEVVGGHAIAFYAQPKFYRDLGKTYNVNVATATLQDFQKLTATTLVDRIRSFIGIDTAVATTTFNVTSTYKPDATGNVTYLIVGGGGGGGGNYGGGGGAGGDRTSTSYAVTSGVTYNVIVGAGGVGGASGVKGKSGASSTFDIVTSTGGGGGGERVSGTCSGQGGKGLDGGSGGGGGGDCASAPGGNQSPSTTPRQGFNGGIGSDGTSGDGGGGGGALEGGQDHAGTNVGGRGGKGASSTISGTDVCYAGGGAGGTNGATAATSTCGGGQGGVANGNGTNGTANTGGGGGGSGGGGSPGTGGRGGDGVVIISFNSTTPAVTGGRPVEDLYIDYGNYETNFRFILSYNLDISFPYLFRNRENDASVSRKEDLI